MGNRIVHLIRHGQYSVDTVEDEEPDGRLTNLGRQQAEYVASYLANHPIETIYYSSLVRAEETAVIIAKQFLDVPFQSSDLLRECIPSVPADLKAHFESIPADYIKAGAVQAAEAFASFFQPLEKEESDREEMLVAHGNIINSFIVKAMNAPLDQWVYLDPFHCSQGQIIVLSSGKMKLVHYNNAGFLPKAYQTL